MANRGHTLMDLVAATTNKAKSDIAHLNRELEKKDTLLKDVSTRPGFTSIGDTFVVLEFNGGSRNVHKDLTCQQSPFFERAFNGSFLEGTTQRVKIDASFRLSAPFLDWLYYARLPTVNPASFNDQTRPRDLALRVRVKLYVFGDQYDVPELKRRCLNEIHRWWAHPDGIDWAPNALQILNDLPESDTLYRIVIYVFGLSTLSHKEEDWATTELQDFHNEFPKAFWVAMTRQLLIWRRTGHPNQTKIPDLAAFEADESIGRPALPQRPAKSDSQPKDDSTS